MKQRVFSDWKGAVIDIAFVKRPSPQSRSTSERVWLCGVCREAGLSWVGKGRFGARSLIVKHPRELGAGPLVSSRLLKRGLAIVVQVGLGTRVRKIREIRK